MPAIHLPVLTVSRFRASFGDAVVPYAAALESGLTRAQLRAALGRGLITSPRRGLLCLPGDDDSQAAHVAATRAAVLAVGQDAHASAHSAALLNDLPLILPLPEPVALLVPGHRSFRGPGLIARGIDLPHDQRSVIDGIPSTGVLRTGIDLARRHRVPSALIPLDAAARHWIGHTTATSGNRLRHAARNTVLRRAAHDALAATAEACLGQHGIPSVRRALPFVDPAAESPAESRSRGWLLEAGVGPLEVGYPVTVGTTTYWADLALPELQLLFEVDGWVKYAGSPAAVRRRLSAERERQRRLERAGWRVVRWAGDEQRYAVVGRAREAISRAR